MNIPMGDYPMWGLVDYDDDVADLGELVGGFLELRDPVDWPRTIRAQPMRRMRVTLDYEPERLLERLLGYLDEEYGDPDSQDTTKPTAAMLAAGQELVEVIKRDYVPWSREPIPGLEIVEINILEWVQEYAPELLEG